VVDQPESEEGTDKGMTPVELFVASLASCVAYYASTFLGRHIPDLTGLEVQSSWNYSEKPSPNSSMHFIIYVPHILTEAEKRAF